MRRLALTLGVAAVALLACTPADEPVVAPADPCRATIDEAAAEAEIRRQVELLDRALVICSGPDVFAANVGRHPTLLGWDVETYLGNRCATAESPSVRGSRICRSDGIVTTTSMPTADAPTIVYVGTTLDGREVTIRPTPSRPFTDEGIPLIIDEMARIAAREGCAGVEAEHLRWLAQIDDPTGGDEASVYARHALDVARFVQCELDL